MEKKSFMQFLDEFEERFLVVEKKESKDKKEEKKAEKKEEKKVVAKKEEKKAEKKEEKKPVKKVVKKTEKKVEEATVVDRAYDILDGITDNAINIKPVMSEGQVPAQAQVVETTADHAADLL